MSQRSDKVALVTGGASGLGEAIAKRLVSDGARVSITDVQVDLGNSVARRYGFTFLEQDVCDEARWTQVINQLEGQCGRLDILVNNAAIAGPMDATDPETTRLADWRRIFSVNVEGVFLGCRAAIPAMRRAGGGSIINISSVASLSATPRATAYGATKAAVQQLTQSVAQYCAHNKLNIRCNSVHPGGVRTQMQDNFLQELARRRGVSLETIVAEVKGAIPMGEFMLPEDIAAAVSFLASEDSRHVTGTKLIVDGGVLSR